MPRSVSEAIEASSAPGFERLYDLSPETSRGEWFGVRALTPAGLVVGDTMPAPRGATLGGHPRVATYDPELVADLSPAARSGPPRQVIAAAARDDIIAWEETPSTDAYHAPWLVFVSVNGERARLVATSEDRFGRSAITPPTPDGDAAISTGSDRVFWTATVPKTSARRFEVDILGAPVHGGRIRTVARNAFHPAAIGTRLYYVRDPFILPTMAGYGEIRVVTADGTDTRVARIPLSTGQSLGPLCAAGNHLAWVRGSRAGRPVITIQRLDTGRRDTLTLNKGGGPLLLSCSESLIAWGNGSGDGDASQYVLDFRSHRLLRLGAREGNSYARVGGDRVAWTFVTGDQRRSSVAVARVGN